MSNATPEDKVRDLWSTMISAVEGARSHESYAQAVKHLTWLLGNETLQEPLLAIAYEEKRTLISRTLSPLWKSEVAINAPLLSALLVIAGMNDTLRAQVLATSHPQTEDDYEGKRLKKRLVWLGIVAIAFIVIIVRSLSSKEPPIARRESESRDVFQSNSDAASDSLEKRLELLNRPRKPIELFQPVVPIAQGRQARTEATFDSSWSAVSYRTGSAPNCFNFKPRYQRSLDNYLRIVVGSGTDVAVKLMDLSTDKCIRYVFVRSGDSYSMTNIPEGSYYLKIGYGRQWIEKVEGGSCVGRFASNPLYEKGEDVLNYYVTKTGTTRQGENVYENLSIPSYEVQLDVTSTGLMNSFDTEKISEAAFNQ